MTTELHDKMVVAKDNLVTGFAQSRIPYYMHNAVFYYVMYGKLPGDFLQAVLRNDLVEAFSRADDVNQQCMKQWATWLYMHCPSGMWRSEKNIKDNLGLFPLCRYCHKVENGVKARDEQDCKENHQNYERPIIL